MKECFLVTTYCDNEEKVKVLEETIESIKKYDIDICIHAHYPLSQDIQNKVNYYIYDVSNPIIPFDVRSIIMWRKIDNLQLNVLKRDYGYTVASQYKQGLLFLNSIGYDVVHVLNYDTVVTDEIMEKSKEIQNYSGVIYLNSETDINLLFVTIKPKDYLDQLRSVSQEDYVLMNEYWYAEKYFYDKFKGNNLYLNDEVKHKNIRHQPHEFHQYDFDNFSIHVGERINWVKGEKIYTGKYSVFFYNIEKQSIDFKVFIGYDLRYLYSEITDNILIDLDITKDDIEQSFGYYNNNQFVKGNSFIKFLINDKILSEDVTSSFCISAIEYDYDK